MKELIKEIKETPILKEKRNFYVSKYSIIAGVLLIFSLFSNIFFFKNFLGFLLLLGFIFTMDLMIVFLKKDAGSSRKDSDVETYEKILLLIQAIAFILCASDVMPDMIKSLFGALCTIAITYFALELVRENSKKPEIEWKKYIKYIPLILLPILFIPPFPIIFRITYSIFYFLLVPGIILAMIYLSIEIKSKVKLPVILSSFIFLYGFLMLCL